ncbi:MAG: hypothetical protein ABSB91_01615 [Sedimentisphaerales bacterium]|jgi:hypothetical protein
MENIVTTIGVVVAVSALVLSFLEYVKQGAQKRAEHFITMRERFKNNEKFQKICNLLDTNDEGLLEIKFEEKRDFLGFFEEVAIAMNSGIIKPQVAHYMFGFYAIKCWESSKFWDGNDVNNEVDKKSKYWVVFKDFVQRMEDIESSFIFERENFRF